MSKNRNNKNQNNCKVEEELLNETLKWLRRIEKEIKTVKFGDKEGREFFENVKAYVKDAHHFLKEKDLIRAFECVVWAWAWLEIGLRMGLLNKV